MMLITIGTWIAISIFVVWIVIRILRIIFRLPDRKNQIESYSIEPSIDTDLGRMIIENKYDHLTKSGVQYITSGGEAYAARIMLAKQAQSSIDARYYIWDKDASGLVLLNELYKAAKRGVRVRILVDDNGTQELDSSLSALNQLENLEVRIFNPFNFRFMRMCSYAIDFFRLNHRMHNKSFSVDGVATVVGGRNIADTYFARGTHTQFADTDILTIGKAANDVAVDFDSYWNSVSSYAHELMVKPHPSRLDNFLKEIDQVTYTEESGQYYNKVIETDLVKKLVSNTLTLEWVSLVLVSDPPSKAQGKVKKSDLMINKMIKTVAEVTQSLDTISAYFVPGKIGTQLLCDLADKGIQVRVLTNSLEATDVIPVHASYTKYRKKLLKQGVEVYELKTQQNEEESRRLGLLGKSAASLHSKTFTFDDDRVFIGSFNFDPRSVYLNCEMGFVVDSKQMNKVMKDDFDGYLSSSVWKVDYHPDGKLRWTSTDKNGNDIVTRQEPGAPLIKRILVTIVSWLPVEWLV